MLQPQLYIIEKILDSDARFSVLRRDIKQLSAKINNIVEKTDEIVRTLKDLSLAAEDSESNNN